MSIINQCIDEADRCIDREMQRQLETKRKYCCEDFRITKEDYKHIIKRFGSDFHRFSGHVITYCPFCGKRLEE